MADAVQHGLKSAEPAASAAVDHLGPKAADVATKATAAKDDVLGLADAASGLAGAALDEGRNLLDNARAQATGFADRQKDQAAQSVADLATSLRNTGDTFEGRPNIQAFVGSAADGLESLAGTIKDRSFIEIYGEAERFARDRPVAVAAGAVVAGFLLARFIKSSAEGLSEAGQRAAAARPPVRRAAAGRVGV